MLVDVGQDLIFPTEIASTNLRPGLVLQSTALKTAYILEFIIPWENLFKEAYSLQKPHYAELAADVKQCSWNTKVYLIKVRCRGFVGSSTSKMLKHLKHHGQVHRAVIYLEIMQFATTLL